MGSHVKENVGQSSEDHAAQQRNGRLAANITQRLSQYFMAAPYPLAALRGLCLVFRSVQMREIFAGVPTVRQRCGSPINSCQSGADKHFVQVTTA